VKKILFILILCSVVIGKDYYVCPAGSDSGPGTVHQPFASLETAIKHSSDFIRSNGYPEDGIVIYLNGGRYDIRKTVIPDGVFSATENSPVVIKPQNDREVILTGGVRMKLSDFTPVSDANILSRLPEESRDKVLQFDLGEIGITEYGELPLYGHSMQFLDKGTPYKSGAPMPELFFDGEALTLARWPNDGYANIEAIVEMGSVPRKWMDDLKGNDNAFSLGMGYIPPEQRDNPPKGFAFKVDSDRLSRWGEAQEPWMYGFWYWNWSEQSVQIKEIDAEEGIIRSVQPSAYGLREGQHFYVYNLMEEIDVPGEWYLDRSTGILYVYPPADSKDANIDLSLFDKTMIKLDNASNVRIEGLTFEVSRGSAVEIAGGSSNSIHNCTIRNFSGDAVIIDGGVNNGVSACRIHGIGGSGISLSGGDRKKLIPAKNYARNNHVHNFSRIVQTYTPGIRLSGVGNIIANNKINDAPHSAIIFEGNDHIIELNEITDVLKNATDTGAIYAGRSHTMWGNKIRNNYFHHIETNIEEGSNSGHSRLVHSIYLDDTLSGIEITGNIFYKVKEALVASGSDITFANNIVIDSKSAVWWKSRNDEHTDYGEYESKEQRLERTRQNNTIADDIAAMPYNSDIWLKRYPNLVTSIEKTYGPQRCVIKNNVMVSTPNAEGTGMSHLENNILKDNMYLNETVLKTGVVENNLVINPDSTFEQWAKSSKNQYDFKIDNELIIREAPGFVDPENNNFKLKEDSPVYEKIPGFEPIPFEKIGLQESDDSALKYSKEPSGADDDLSARAEQPSQYDPSTDLSLSPDQRRWELILKENLGDFYYPLYLRERAQGKEQAWDYVEDSPDLPRILIIGDSISRGYTLPVRHSLSGRANVHRAPANCGPTAKGLDKLDVWLGEGRWDLISFNFGIHDRSTPPDVYEKNLRQIIARLEETGAKLVWVNSTPIPKGADIYVEGAIERVNDISQKLMEENNIPMIDLNSYITAVIDEYQLPDNCHFKTEGYEYMGRFVAENIERFLQDK
jgi:lysophospholipase L1-like esterase